MKPNLNSKSIFALATFLLIVLLLPNLAQAANTRDRVEKEYSAYWHKAKDKLGARTPGRNIRKWGIQTKNGKSRDARISELQKSTVRLKDMTASAPVAINGSTYATSTQTATGGSNGLSSIAQCESGGDPNAVSPDGQYRGLYQFDTSTYHAYGGQGDPAQASVEEQTRIAQKLPRSSWPNC